MEQVAGCGPHLTMDDEYALLHGAPEDDGKALLVSFSKNKAVVLSDLESLRAPVLEVSSSSLWFASSSMVEN